MEFEEKPSFLIELQNILSTYDFSTDKEKKVVIDEILTKYFKVLKNIAVVESNTLKNAPDNLKEAVNINEEEKKVPLKKVPINENENDSIKEIVNNEIEENLVNKSKVLKIKKEFYCDLVNLRKLYEDVYQKAKKPNDRIILKELIESTDNLIEDVEEFNNHSTELNKIECRLNITLPRNVCASYKRIFEYLSYLISKINKLKLINKDPKNKEFLNDINLTLTVHQNKINNLILNCIF